VPELVVRTDHKVVRVPAHNLKIRQTGTSSSGITAAVALPNVPITVTVYVPAEPVTVTHVETVTVHDETTITVPTTVTLPLETSEPTQ
jgi:hypothetical protein